MSSDTIYICFLTFTTDWANSADVFLILPRKYALTFHANCLPKQTFFHFSKMSPEETNCMKSQTLFSGKNKDISKYGLLKFLPGMLSVIKYSV